jgi:hypothetical protein
MQCFFFLREWDSSSVVERKEEVQKTRGGRVSRVKREERTEAAVTVTEGACRGYFNNTYYDVDGGWRWWDGIGNSQKEYM